MADVAKTPSPTKSEGSPKKSIRVLTSKSEDSDNTKIEVKVAPLGEKKLTIEIKKGQDESDDKKKGQGESDDKKKVQGESDDKKKGESDDEKGPKEVTPITDDEVEEIVAKFKSMDDKELKMLLDFFWSVDEYHFGAFTVHQLAYRLASWGFYPTTKQIAMMFSDLDRDNDMLVSLEEFLTDMAKPKRKQLSESEVKVWFDRFDTDHDGYVTRDDISQTVDSLGTYLLAPQLNEFMKHDRSGKMERLDFDEFCHAYKMSPK